METSAPLSQFSEEALKATWKSLIKTNLESKFNKPKWQLGRLPAGRFPSKRCMHVTLKSSSTTTRRGKRPRAYPRKGVVKTAGDERASKKKIGAHQLAAFIGSGRFPEVGEQASHWFCDDETCVNPSHIVWETAENNATRYCCKVFKEKKGYRCPHEPTCPGCKPCVKESN